MPFKIKRKYKVNSVIFHWLNYFYYRFLIKCDYSKTVSIIIACKNAEKTILQTLNGLENQTYKNIEIIVINDGSTDNSLNLINNYINSSNLDITIKNLTESKGAANARNIGINLAKGFYICFNDADDISHKRRIEFQVKALQKSSKRIFSECLYFRTYKGKQIAINGKKFLLCIISMMFERDTVLAELGGMADISYAEDSEFRERMIANFGDESGKIIYFPLYKANFSPDSYYFSGVDELSFNQEEVKFKIPERKELEYLREKWHNEIRAKKLSAHLRDKPEFNS